MDFKQFTTGDERAVSPVIGVILMVAITVILAAVIGTFVLGLGDQVSSTAPSASIQFSDNDTALTGTAGEAVLDIRHGGGESLALSETRIQISGAVSSSADPMTSSLSGTTLQWLGATAPSGDFTTASILYIEEQGAANLASGSSLSITLVDKESGQIVAEDTVEVN